MLTWIFQFTGQLIFYAGRVARARDCDGLRQRPAIRPITHLCGATGSGTDIPAGRFKSAGDRLADQWRQRTGPPVISRFSDQTVPRRTIFSTIGKTRERQ